jgi:hypothetical protein
VLLDEFLNVARSEARDLSKADTWQARLLARDVVIDPRFTDAEPSGNFVDVQ